MSNCQSVILNILHYIWILQHIYIYDLNVAKFLNVEPVKGNSNNIASAYFRLLSCNGTVRRPQNSKDSIKNAALFLLGVSFYIHVSKFARDSCRRITEKYSQILFSRYVTRRAIISFHVSEIYFKPKQVVNEDVFKFTSSYTAVCVHQLEYNVT